MALRVLAAFLSCFFSVLFLTAFGFLMLEIAKAVVAKDGPVLEAQCDSPDFSNCLGTNLASRGNGLISSNFDELFDVKTATFFSISGVVGTVRGYCAVELFTDFCTFCRHLEPRTCSESLRFMTDAKATGSWLIGHKGFKWLKSAKNNSSKVISRIFKIWFQQICIISVSGDRKWRWFHEFLIFDFGRIA